MKTNIILIISLLFSTSAFSKTVICNPFFDDPQQQRHLEIQNVENVNKAILRGNILDRGNDVCEYESGKLKAAFLTGYQFYKYKLHLELEIKCPGQTYIVSFEGQKKLKQTDDDSIPFIGFLTAKFKGYENAMPYIPVELTACRFE